MARESRVVSKDRSNDRSSPDSLSVEFIVSVSVNKILDHPGRVTLKTEELFVVLLSSTIESREGRVILKLVS